MKGIDEVILITKDKAANESIIVALIRKALGVALLFGVMHYLIMGSSKAVIADPSVEPDIPPQDTMFANATTTDL